MAFYKVIASGHVMEIYQYEKEPSEIRKGKEEKYNEYEKIVLGLDDENWIYEKEDRTQDRRKQTMRDARNTARRIALMNFSQGSAFVTLTYPDTRHLTADDIEVADDDFKKFMKRLKYRYNRKFDYIAVREFTKKGRIHFHALMDFDVTGKSEDDIKAVERYWGEDIWKHGFVDIKAVQGQVDNIGAYLIKYMTKGVAEEVFKGRKLYLTSKGLKRPVTLTGDAAEMVIAEYGLLGKKEVFTNSYESEYLGHIAYREYNLKRL